MKLLSVLRTHQWWKPKASNILGLVYFGIYYLHINVSKLFILLPLAVCTLLGIGISGYVFNDWADRVSDLEAGKPNRLANLNTIQFLGLVGVALLLSWLPWIFLPRDFFSFILLGLQWFLLFFYAFPPLRLKENPIFSIPTDALYAYAIPTVLAFYTFSFYSNSKEKWMLISVLFFWQFFVGIQNYLIHVISDYANDVKSETKTAATVYGQNAVNKIRVALIIPTLLLFIWFLAISKLPIWYLFIACLFYFGINYFRISTFNLKVLKSTILPDLMQVLNFNTGSFFAWVVVLYLTYIYKFGFVFLLLHVFLFERQWLMKVINYPPFRYILSHLVNHSIYWFRRLVLFKNDIEARGSEADEYLKEQLVLETRRVKGSVAIFNKNYQKYTETFVHGHSEQLDFANDFFHGDGIPAQRNGEYVLYTDSISIWIKRGLELFFLGENYFLKRYYSNYLKRSNVKIAIVHFGTTAVEVVDLLKENGIPMLVIFYGYDAWHTDFLDKNKAKYQEVFSYSSKIIGVSKDICRQLVKLGAEEHKVEYIPCFVNTKLFTYSDHTNNENIILAVGRFAETKSPHLTILAFNEVLKKIPDARLVMIGKDGGGELFEACIILARALSIEDKIEFKGICSPEQVKLEMDKAKVFVQHSVTTPLNGDKEGTPVAVMEALLNGLPIVATRHAGIAEIVEEGVNGFLVEEYDYLGMADRILFCLREKMVTEDSAQSVREILKSYQYSFNQLVNSN